MRDWLNVIPVRVLLHESPTEQVKWSMPIVYRAWRGSLGPLNTTQRIDHLARLQGAKGLTQLIKSIV